MYASCLACARSLGRNTELPHLPVGRRVAFDTTTGRLWVICPHCGQWNLTPPEERWEALAECEAAAALAEARAAGAEVGLAQTATGLELLRVGGMTDAGIANWRYGKRLRSRQRRVNWTLVLLLTLATVIGAAVGVMSARASGAAIAGAYVGAALCFFLFHVVQNPPRLPARVPDGAGGTRLLWPWDFQHVRFEGQEPGEPLTLVIPRGRGPVGLRGMDAARALAAILPKVNGADCGGEALADALKRVERAEALSVEPWKPGRRNRRGRKIGPPPHRRPWEHLAAHEGFYWLTSTSPANRLALEMAVTEELEQRAMQSRAESLTPEWREQDTIGEIADDLLVPDDVAERLRLMQARRDTSEDEP